MAAHLGVPATQQLSTLVAEIGRDVYKQSYTKNQVDNHISVTYMIETI